MECRREKLKLCLIIALNMSICSRTIGREPEDQIVAVYAFSS